MGNPRIIDDRSAAPQQQVPGWNATSPEDAIFAGPSASSVIRIGLVGCGHRGTGAAAQALKADRAAELVAVADIAEDHIENCLHMLNRVRKIAGQVCVEARKFVGIEGVHHVLRSDVDLVILATPPGFRPAHLEACVAAGKHVFCEKPVATDSPGVRAVMRAAEQAKAKNLSLMGGLCMRYNPVLQEMFDALAGGAIGRLTAYHATYFSNEVKAMLPASARPAGMSDTEWQIRNWYNFVWLSGDSLVEQAIHSIDRISWAMNDQPPLHCVGSGGRAIPESEGNIYDHFSVVYSYGNGAQAVLNSRQIDGCYNSIQDLIIGTEGTCTYGRGPFPVFRKTNPQPVKDGKPLSPAKAAANYLSEHSGPIGTWLKTRSDVDVYQAQQDILLAAIRNGRRVDDAEQLTTSTLLAIMGRTAAYTGQQVTWDQILHSDERLVPEHIDWNADMPPMPRARPGLRVAAPQLFESRR